VKVFPRRRADVYTVTDAPVPLSQDIGYRQRRYLLSMGVRTVCFVTAVIAAAAGAPFWVALLLVVGATVLPYVSVVMANGGREPQPRMEPTDDPAGSAPRLGTDRKQISGPPPEIGA